MRERKEVSKLAQGEREREKAAPLYRILKLFQLLLLVLVLYPASGLPGGRCHRPNSRNGRNLTPLGDEKKFPHRPLILGDFGRYLAFFAYLHKNCLNKFFLQLGNLD